MYTVPCLLVSEIPTFVFTLFDMFHLFSSYRENDRPYPSSSDLHKVAVVYCRNVIGIILLSVLGMEFFIRTDTIPYDMSSDIATQQAISQLVQVTLATEFLFYWLHRYVHYNRTLYRLLHFDHHHWRYNSFALVNHDLTIPEIGIFAFCPAIPCMVLGVNWRVMLIHAIYTNSQGAYSHCGYRFRLLDMLLLTDSRDHDNHHKHPTYNYAGGGWYSIMDRIFGTHYPL